MHVLYKITASLGFAFCLWQIDEKPKFIANNAFKSYIFSITRRVYAILIQI